MSSYTLYSALYLRPSTFLKRVPDHLDKLEALDAKEAVA